MECNLTTAFIMLIIFVSTLIRATFGFGNAMLAMPLLALFLDMRTVTPLVAVVALTIAVMILAGHWRDVHPESAWRLIVSTLAGMPFGLLLLMAASEVSLKILLSCLLILFSLNSLAGPKWPKLKSNRWAFGFGFVAGILLSALNTNGPVVVIFGALRKWKPAMLRATLQGYFLPTAALVVAVHGFGGLLTREVLGYYIGSLPLVVAAVLLGNRLHGRIPAYRYDQAVFVLLLSVGVFLLASTIPGLL